MATRPWECDRSDLIGPQPRKGASQWAMTFSKLKPVSSLLSRPGGQTDDGHSSTPSFFDDHTPQPHLSLEMESPTIAARTIDCGRSLSRLCDILAKEECKYGNQIELPVARDELGRFRVWAGNVGAHRSGRVSLDYRLREARDMREGVCKLLDHLKIVLERAYSILSGKQLPHDVELFDPDSSDDGIDAVNLLQPKTELQEIFRSVQKVIVYLYDLALYFRRPAQSDRLPKLAKIDISHFREWDQRHVEEKFPHASPALIRRLGRANSERRRMFEYREKHHDKLSRNLDTTTLTTLEPKAESDTNVGGSRYTAKSGLPRVATGATAAPSTSAATADTQTTVATFVDTGEVITDDTLSETSSAASEGPDEESTLHLPSLPKGATYGEIFQCPYCYDMMKINTGRSWSCSFPNRTFGTRHEWFDHEAQIHRGGWHCSECSIESPIRASFENHIRLEHRQLFEDNQLPALAELCVMPMEKRATGKCPLCLKDGQHLRSHIARHMQTVALFVLPRTSDEGGSVFGSDGAQIWGSEDDASGSSVPQSDQMSEVSTEVMKKTPDLDPEGPTSASTSLHQLSLAAGLGDLERVRALLRTDGLNPNLKDDNGKTPLASAARNGHESVVMMLLEHKEVDPNVKSEGGGTPLMFAVESGHEAIVRALLENEAVDPDRMNFSFRTPLVAAIDNGNEAMIRILLEDKRTDPTITNRSLQSPLSYAAEGGKEEIAKILLEYSTVNPNQMNSKHQTPLMFATESSNDSLARIVLQNERVNPNLMNRIFQTPLVIAAQSGNDSMVKTLLGNKETDPNIRDPDNRTPLMLATTNGHVAVLRTLLSHPKTNPNSSIDGQTALMLATQTGNEEAVRALIEYKTVDINARNHIGGLTALAYAAQSGRLAVAKTLLSRRDIDIDTEDREGHTALWWAEQGGHRDVEQLLAEHRS
ncbi:MAG: hypothetical protein M1840_000954 [Geoglossum simile]|nr:MAG: hypothetical protein M1840_000954 [Geoglossum simile]